MPPDLTSMKSFACCLESSRTSTISGPRSISVWNSCESRIAKLPYSIATTDRGCLSISRKNAARTTMHQRNCIFCAGPMLPSASLTWDYGQPGFAREMLEEFELLVAPRGEHYVPTAEFRDRVHSL